MLPRLGCFILSLTLLCVTCEDDLSDNTRYVLYDVNPGEGFNLRRDVYMRMAVFVRKLNLDSDTRWVLVLPPWGHLYHWQSRELGHQIMMPWGDFFDIRSLNHYVPVMEFEEWRQMTGGVMDSVYYLQGYKEGWKDGKFEEKYDISDCLEEPRYQLNSDNKMFSGHFFFYQDIFAKKFACLSVQGMTRVLSKFIKSLTDQSVMLDRAENLLHDFFGDADYWAARRSMRFSAKLVAEADRVRREQLGSEDWTENTEVKEDWWRHRAGRQQGRGGDYGCVHMRRGDFARSRGSQVPSVASVGKQLAQRLKKRDLDLLFVATDASEKELKVLRDNTPGIRVSRYRPSEAELRDYRDGGVAIIDQIVCSHARYFIGTRESTFTFRIQEEREMMGFSEDETFDMLCRDGETKCEGGTQWKIDWGPVDKDWSLSKGKDYILRTEL